MPYQVSIIRGDQVLRVIPLDKGRVTLGSDPASDICVNSDEVAAQAAEFKVRGDAVFVQNLNDFAIYVGTEALEPHTTTDWNPAAPIQISRNISLSLTETRSTAPAPDAEAETRKKRTRSTVQIAVIFACILVGYWVVTGDESSSALAERSGLGFNDVLRPLLQLTGDQPLGSANAPAPSTLSFEHRLILSYLTDARIADVRWGRTDPRRAVNAYEVLLSCPPIRNATGASKTEFNIKMYAQDRISVLAEKRD